VTHPVHGADGIGPPQVPGGGREEAQLWAGDQAPFRQVRKRIFPAGERAPCRGREIR
jgi:hypothetical protein